MAPPIPKTPTLIGWDFFCPILGRHEIGIPIAYYLYHKGRDVSTGKNGVFSSINKQAFHVLDRKLIRQWLHMSLLKGVFGGHGDALLTNLRKIIKANISEASFPLTRIIEDYRGHSKDLLFDDDFISRLLKTQKAVSYTHLDVYKRQTSNTRLACSSASRTAPCTCGMQRSE